VPPKLPEIARTVQKVEVRLGDGNVVRGRVTVKFLVPLCEKGALDAGPVAFLYPVVSKKVQDGHADSVAVTTATRENPERHARNVSLQDQNFRFFASVKTARSVGVILSTRHQSVKRLIWVIATTRQVAMYRTIGRSNTVGQYPTVQSRRM
jgi:hypothetical protein